MIVAYLFNSLHCAAALVGHTLPHNLPQHYIVLPRTVCRASARSNYACQTVSQAFGHRLACRVLHTLHAPDASELVMFNQLCLR